MEAAVGETLRTHRRVAFIGENPPETWAVEANPAPLIHRLHYQRACKTNFEIACLEQATENGVKGHIAAREAYRANGSEFDILRAFLAGSRTDRGRPGPTPASSGATSMRRCCTTSTTTAPPQRTITAS